MMMMAFLSPFLLRAGIWPKAAKKKVFFDAKHGVSWLLLLSICDCDKRRRGNNTAN
jgi:hypothetical protein